MRNVVVAPLGSGPVVFMPPIRKTPKIGSGSRPRYITKRIPRRDLNRREMFRNGEECLDNQILFKNEVKPNTRVCFVTQWSTGTGPLSMFSFSSLVYWRIDFRPYYIMNAIFNAKKKTARIARATKTRRNPGITTGKIWFEFFLDRKGQFFVD